MVSYDFMNFDITPRIVPIITKTLTDSKAFFLFIQISNLETV